MCFSRMCYLVLLLVSPGQELHDHHVGFGHLEDAVHLSAANINNQLAVTVCGYNSESTLQNTRRQAQALDENIKYYIILLLYYCQYTIFM